MHGNIDTCLQLFSLQYLLDLRCRFSCIPEHDRIFHRLLLCHRNSLVIHYTNLSLVFLRQRLCRMTSAAQSAGHWNVHDLIVLFQQLVPAFHDFTRRWLRRGNIRIFSQTLIKFLLRQRNIFQKQLPVNKERHGNHMNSHRFSHFLRNTTVAVRYDCNFFHLFSPVSSF